MKELKLNNPLKAFAEQFECPNCKKKTYINQEDFDSAKVLDCPFCNVHGIKNVRTFEVVINKIFEK